MYRTVRVPCRNQCQGLQKYHLYIMAILTISLIWEIIIDGQKRSREILRSGGLTIVRQDQSQLAVEMYVSLGVNLCLKTAF
jgi:hypothetical protein